MDKQASSPRESMPRAPAGQPAERPYAGAHLEDFSPAGDSLRAFADLARNGPRAVAQRRALTSMFGSHAPPAAEAAVQRKLEMSRALDRLGKPQRLRTMLEAHDIGRLHERVLGAIDANLPMLAAMKLPGLAETHAELRRPLAFENNLWSLVDSPVDYGEINLDNPQHVYLYVKEASRFLNVNYAASEAGDVKAELLKEQKLREKGVFTGPASRSPGLAAETFHVALLGTSASIADYITVHGTALDPASTVIIGDSQPWKPSPDDLRSRGITFINHPAHMTSPLRDTTQLPEAGAPETFEGAAKRLSDDIDAVIMRFGARKVPATITKVSRLEEVPHVGWYQIQTSAGRFFTRKVVSGLGIGPHRFAGMNKVKSPSGEVAGPSERVMDLDAFQRAAGNPLSELSRQNGVRKLRIGVSGPNAGTDAVHTATAKGMTVHWMVSADGPAIAEGMGNAIGAPGLVTVYFDYLNGWTLPSATQIQLDISGKAWPDKGVTREKAEQKFLSGHHGWNPPSRGTSVEVDYLVIAQGPNVPAIWNVFDPTATKALELKGDKNGRFGAPTAIGDSFNQGPSDTVRNIGIRRVLIEASKSGGIAGGDSFIYSEVGDELLGRAHAILGVTEFAPITLQAGVAPRLASTDNSFEIIGGSAIRILNYLDGLATPARPLRPGEVEAPEAGAARLEREKHLSEIPDGLKGGGKEDQMKKVLETLSSPTILNNDQLTPIRSQIEAAGDYAPGYVGTKESNFVTDDQTMIAAQIAAAYPDIPGELANWVTQKIIQDRRRTPSASGPSGGIRPGTTKGSREFVDRWKGKLAELNTAFSPTRLQGLIAEAVTAAAERRR